MSSVDFKHRTSYNTSFTLNFFTRYARVSCHFSHPRIPIARLLPKNLKKGPLALIIAKSCTLIFMRVEITCGVSEKQFLSK